MVMVPRSAQGEKGDLMELWGVYTVEQEWSTMGLETVPELSQGRHPTHVPICLRRHPESRSRQMQCAMAPLRRGTLGQCRQAGNASAWKPTRVSQPLPGGPCQYRSR